ncbi:MAG: hypothetical protein R3C05_05445 [Pirellulaceae bacterium]
MADSTVLKQPTLDAPTRQYAQWVAEAMGLQVFGGDDGSLEIKPPPTDASEVAATETVVLRGSPTWSNFGLCSGERPAEQSSQAQRTIPLRSPRSPRKS